MVLDKKGHVMIVFTGSVKLFKWLHSWCLRMNNKWVMNPPIGWIFKCSFSLINSPTIYICILVKYWHNYILLLWFLWCYFIVRGTLKCVLHTADGPSLNKITAPLYSHCTFASMTLLPFHSYYELLKLSISLLLSRPIQFRDNMPYHTQMWVNFFNLTANSKQNPYLNI